MKDFREKNKKCRYCRKVFAPDPRVGDRQVSCKATECRKKRKQMAQRKWRQANPDYFQGRYLETKMWRERNPGYQNGRRRKMREIQDKMGGKNPVKTIRLMVPTCILKNEIKDEIHLKHLYNRGVTSVFVHEIQDEIGFT